LAAVVSLTQREIADWPRKRLATAVAKENLQAKTSQFWDPEFVSMIIFSVNGKATTEDTCAFFKHREAVVRVIESDAPDEEE